VRELETKVRYHVEHRRPGHALITLAVALDELRDEVVALSDETLGEDWGLPLPASEDPGPEPSDPRDRLVWEAKRRAAQDAGRTTPDIGVAGTETSLVRVGDGQHEVRVPQAPPEVIDRRSVLVKDLHLGDGNWWTRPELAIDPAVAVDAYIKGGPVWLHAYDRDFVMGLPKATRVAMVQDLETHAPEDAHALARDILKDESPDGARAIQLEGQGHVDL